MCLLQGFEVGLVHVYIDGFQVLQSALGNVDEVISRLGECASIGLAEDLLAVHLAHAVVVVLAPTSIGVVLDVRVVGAALRRAVVDADAMQVVLVVLQAQVLVRK